VPLEAARGLIRDRNGEVLVDNRISYTISAVPPRLIREKRLDEDAIHRLCEVVGLGREEVMKSLRSKSRFYYEPVKLKRDVGFETVARVEEARYDLPGVVIQVESRRRYPLMDGQVPMASHVLGNTSMLDSDEYAKLSKQGYSLGDFIGKRGVEKLCEDRLRGKNGFKYVRVNAVGREVGQLSEKTRPPTPGQDVTLTLDRRVQQAAEQAFADSLVGSLVAMDPRNGEILAILNRPRFDTNTLSASWNKLEAHPKDPLINRALVGLYPPGSTMKMVAAIAGLELGKIDDHTVKYAGCGGGIQIGNHFFKCMHRHGALNLYQALAHSCNVYFIQLGRDVGFDEWYRYGRALGMGERTGIDLAGGGDGEKKGLLPSRSYYGRRVSGGVMGNLAIGQGELSVTPLQMARYISAIATGTLVTPHVIKDTPVDPPKPLTGVSPRTLQIIRAALMDVVQAGTGRRAQVKNYQIAGKTGTSQNPHGRDHAWFLAFAPFERPTIALAVVVENAPGTGGAVAAPISQKVLQTYLEIMGTPVDPTSRLAAQRVEAPRPEVQ
jgi:penicillin-binding protein 2